MFWFLSPLPPFSYYSIIVSSYPLFLFLFVGGHFGFSSFSVGLTLDIYFFTQTSRSKLCARLKCCFCRNVTFLCLFVLVYGGWQVVFFSWDLSLVCGQKDSVILMLLLPTQLPCVMFGLGVIPHIQRRLLVIFSRKVSFFFVFFNMLIVETVLIKHGVVISCVLKTAERAVMKSIEVNHNQSLLTPVEV